MGNTAKSAAQRTEKADSLASEAKELTAKHGINIGALITIGSHVFQDVVEAASGSPVTEVIPVRIPGIGKRVKVTVELVD